MKFRQISGFYSATEPRLEGFDFKAPTRLVKTEEYGYDCFIVHGYAFRYIRKNDKVVIYQKDELRRI